MPTPINQLTKEKETCHSVGLDFKHFMCTIYPYYTICTIVILLFLMNSDWFRILLKLKSFFPESGAMETLGRTPQGSKVSDSVVIGTEDCHLYILGFLRYREKIILMGTHEDTPLHLPFFKAFLEARLAEESVSLTMFLWVYQRVLVSTVSPLPAAATVLSLLFDNSSPF